MNLLQFIQEFPDEAACRQKFKEERDKIGITCKSARIITGSGTSQATNARSATRAPLCDQAP